MLPYQNWYMDCAQTAGFVGSNPTGGTSKVDTEAGTFTPGIGGLVGAGTPRETTPARERPPTLWKMTPTGEGARLLSAAYRKVLGSIPTSSARKGAPWLLPHKHNSGVSKGGSPKSPDKPCQVRQWEPFQQGR